MTATVPDDSSAVVVFTGPSLAVREVSCALPEAVVKPPAARGDLYRARRDGAMLILLIDGVFAHHLAVSPREVIDVVRDGATVVGASSMGALRAAECAPAGVAGVGLVYRLFRRGVLENDDEVAVALSSDRDFAATSVALVNVRYAVSKARRARLLTSLEGARIVAAAKGMFYAERTWPDILRQANVGDSAGDVLRFCQGRDLKRQDALQAVREVSALHRTPRHTKTRCGQTLAVPMPRYPGHDRYFGLGEATLRHSLAEWLFGSGRYQPHVWAIMAGEPELSGLSATLPERVHHQRDALAAALRRHLADIGEVSRRLWAELEYLDELDAELMRWYAFRRLSEMAERKNLKAPADITLRVREEVARRHGVFQWSALEEAAEDGRLHGAIPLAWVYAATDVIIQARTVKRLGQ